MHLVASVASSRCLNVGYRFDSDGVEGFDADADVGRQLLRRGLDDWQRERATYPGSDLVERGIEVSAVGFVVALMVTISTSGGVALGESMALAAVVMGFVVPHYAALLMQQRGEI